MTVTGGKFVVYRPGSIVTFTTAAAVTAGRLVEITADMTVGMPAGTSRKVIGVAMQDSDAAGDKIPVQLLGYVFRLRANGAVAAGDELVSNANGDVSTLAAASTAVAADINNARAVVGVALEAITTATSGRVYVGRA